MIGNLGYSIAIIIAISFPSISQAEPDKKEIQISEDSFIVLIAKLGNATLFEELFGYLYNDSVLVPFSLIVEALEFPIEINPVEGLADGWFLEENRRFSLNIGADEVFIEGQKQDLPGNLPTILKDDDIFVDIRLLEQWFPLKVQFSFNDLALFFHPQEPLPIQQRLSRKERREKQKKRKIKELDLPYLNLSRSWLSWPSTDFTFDMDLQPSTSGHWLPGIHYSTSLDMSLLTLDSKWFVSGSTDALLSNARASFSHPEFGSGWLKNTRLSFGDMNSPSTSHVASSKDGIGLELTNTTPEISNRFNQITLEDNIPPGWEIELYRNNQLLDFREVGEDGRYRFEDIDLLFGENIFRLVSYGPQGQIREKYKRYRIGQNMTPPHELHYRFAWNQTSTNLLPITASGTQPDSQNNEDQSHRYYADLQWGTNDWLTLIGRWNWLTLGDEKQGNNFVTLGARTFFLNSYLEWDTTVHMDSVTLSSSSANRIHLKTQFNKIQADLQYDYYNNFSSETISSLTKSISKLTSKLHGPLNLSIIGLPTVRWQWSNQVEQHSDNQFGMNSNLQTATNIGGLSLSNSLVFSGSEHWSRIDSAGGALLFGGRLHEAVRSRGSLSYQLGPEFYFNTLSLDADTRLNDDLSFGVNASYDLNGEEEAKYGLSLKKNIHHENFSLGVNLGHDKSGFNIGLGLLFSFGRQNGNWKTSNERMTGQGSIVARSFIDQNNNGKYDLDKDDLVGKVRYKVNGFEHKTKSDAKGEALLNGLSLSKTSNITIIPDSLPDPFIAPAHPGVAIKANLGYVPTIDFPLVNTGEIDGSIYILNNGKPQAIKADLQLVDKKGKIIQEVRSAYDGFYLFSYVPMGKYQIRVTPKLADRLHPESIKLIDVEIKPGEEFLNGMDMLLKLAN